MPLEKDNVKYALHIKSTDVLNLQALEHSAIILVPLRLRFLNLNHYL